MFFKSHITVDTIIELVVFSIADGLKKSSRTQYNTNQIFRKQVKLFAKLFLAKSIIDYFYVQARRVANSNLNEQEKVKTVEVNILFMLNYVHFSKPNILLKLSKMLNDCMCYKLYE